MDKLGDEYLGYRVKVLHKFDQNMFDRLFADCKNETLKNTPWNELEPKANGLSDDGKEQLLCKYFKDHFSLKGRLHGALVFGVYHVDDPDRILFYCAGRKEGDIQALKWGLTLFGKDKNGSKAWVWDFFTINVKLYKPFVESLGLSGYYYTVKEGGSVDSKKANGKGVVLRDSIFNRTQPHGTIMFSSPYGFGQKYEE